MKVIKRIVVAFLAIVSVAITAQAQVVGQEEMILYRVVEKVSQMNNYVSQMADLRRPMDYRERRKSKALNLFIGKGYNYEENGVDKTGVLMQVTSKTRKSIGNQLVREYYDGLLNKLPKIYTDVSISATDFANIKVSTLEQIDINLWVCTCQYDQAFVGMRDGKPIYKDITTKRIKCYVVVEDTEDGYEYIILLGDTYAIATK